MVDGQCFMGFVIHESYVLCVLTNSVALLTANHSSPLHSLSDPEERSRGTTAMSFLVVFLSLASLLFLSLKYFVLWFFSCMNRCSKEFHCQVGDQDHSGSHMEVFGIQVSIQMHSEYWCVEIKFGHQLLSGCIVSSKYSTCIIIIICILSSLKKFCRHPIRNLFVKFNCFQWKDWKIFFFTT